MKLKIFSTPFLFTALLPAVANLFASSSVPNVTTAQNWSQSLTAALTAGTSNTVTLTPCPVGVDTTTGLYQVYISDGAKSETVGNKLNPIRGSCTSGASFGTITFVPYFSHSNYTIGSASSGLQETVNQACGTDGTYWKNGHCNVTLPAGGPGYPPSINTYNIYGTLYWHANESVLNGDGAKFNCMGTQRGPCIQIGDLVSSNHSQTNKIKGLTFANPNPESSLDSCHQGVLVTNTAANGSYKTITTATAHNCRAGDIVTIRFTDDSHYWGDGIVYDCGSGSSAGACTSSSTTLRIAYTGTIASAATPGVLALDYAAILDNAMHTEFDGISSAGAGNYTDFNSFFDIIDDENAVIRRFNNNAVSLNHGAHWSGAYVQALGFPGRPAAPVITLEDSNITANLSECVTDTSDNGLYIENTVCQASGLWQIHSSVETSGIGKGTYVKNLYSESSIAMNPPCTGSCPTGATSPYPGTGIAGLFLGSASPGQQSQFEGSTPPVGAFQTGGTGSTPLEYWIVANDVTKGWHTSPMPILVWSSTGTDSPIVNWPRVANAADAITYDIIRATKPVNPGDIFPYNGGCTGGAGGICGSVATGLAQASVCTINGGLVCTFTDTASASTSAYTINSGSYGGTLSFWPGSLVSNGQTLATNVEIGNVTAINAGGQPIQVAQTCNVDGQATAGGGYTACLVAEPNSGGQNSNLTATLLADNFPWGAQNTAVTGRLNFPSSGYAWQAHQIMTLMDSNPFLTEATIGYRRPASVNDAWIGTDAPHNTPLSTTMLAIGAGQSITEYIANIGSTGTYPYGGAGWLERLTSRQKTFAVPVKINDGSSFTLGNGSPLSQMKIYSVNNLPVSHVPPQSCVDVIGKANGVTKSDQITSITPPGRLGNLSLNAYPAGEDSIILHFCNPSGSEAITPAGAYSFLAVR